jgi:inward rectifier potassium channel
MNDEPALKPPPTPRVIGAPRAPVRDAYHWFLRVSWASSLGVIVAGFLALNVIFALIYVAVGGIAHARPHSFLDAFFFSVQTLATIGYGAMYPARAATETIVVAEAVCGLIVTALATGLVFSKFARTTARVMFTRHAVIAPYDGVPHLMIRIGNQRGNQIVDAQLRINFSRREVTREGTWMYRMYDLALVRDRAPAVSRSWTMMHVIDASSPLHGETPESLAANEGELLVSVVGLDDTALQMVHVSHTYDQVDLRWGMRHVDILTVAPDGALIVDLRRFHDLEPTEAIVGFPYPRPGAASA